MSGLFAAAFLRQIGWRCDVYERSPVELVGRGAGITTHPELLDALEKSGAGTRNLGIEVPKRIAIDRDDLASARETGTEPIGLGGLGPHAALRRLAAVRRIGKHDDPHDAVTIDREASLPQT